MKRAPALMVAVTLPVWLLHAQSAPAPNQLAGTWRMVSATLAQNRQISRPYGPRPAGMLVFTRDMHMVEVLTDADTPRFASNTRGRGTDVENRRAMSSSIGFFGSYTVDTAGRFSGNRVEGATFPNWIGSVRTTSDLQLIVKGDRMLETFTRPDGGFVRAEFRRVGRPS